MKNYSSEFLSYFNGKKIIIAGCDGYIGTELSNQLELNNIELSMYDLVIGASIITEMGGERPGIIKDLRRGLDWFRTHSPEAYMVLLD